MMLRKYYTLYYVSSVYIVVIISIVMANGRQSGVNDKIRKASPSAWVG